MRKILLVVICFMTVSLTFAANLVGVSSLILPQDNDYIVNYNSGRELEQIKQTNKIVTALTIKALNKFNTDLLATKSPESSIALFNAGPNIQDIVKNNSKFLDDIATQDMIPTTESTAVVIEKHNHKFYLIGHVTKVSCGEMRHKIMTSTDISWLYNLDIVIKFRVVDANTLRPIAEFTAIGHGGVAKILNNAKQAVEIKPDKIVNAAMNALTDNIWHDLLTLNQRVD